MGTTTKDTNKRIGIEVLDPEILKIIADISAQADLTYTHQQIVPEKIWAVNHSLGKYPSVTVVDSSGNVVMGDVSYIDQNNLTISFSCSFSGSVYCN